jgi:predicted nucleotidyltransferase component of viral defense system
MSTAKYKDQVRLLLDVLPEIAAEECFALHGGTAINLFVRDMPRLSVDLDLTYLPIEDRATSLTGIARALQSARDRIAGRLPNVRVTDNPDHSKLLCSRLGVQIKVEVNTTMRGSLGEPIVRVLSEKTQETFERFAEMRVLPIGQLYGGKICAALDRQHPRDLFDIRYMLQYPGFNDEIRRGFLLCLLCGDRPMHEVISPSLLDQRETLENHFAGMAEEPFSYDEFEEARRILIEKINSDLAETDRRFLISFKDGEPAWNEYGFAEFEKFPAVQWKLQNIRKLKASNPAKHREQLEALRSRLGVNSIPVSFLKPRSPLYDSQLKLVTTQ